MVKPSTQTGSENNCIFCGTKLNDSNESVEHVLLNCLGGRLTTNGVICATCNVEKFGSVIDKSLCEELATIRTLGQFPSGANGNRSDPPAHVFPKKSGTLMGDGQMKLPPKVSFVQDKNSLEFEVEGSPEKVHQIVRAKLASLDVAEEKIEEILKSGEYFTKKFPQPINFSFDAQKIIPSLFKQSMVLLARELGNSAISEEFDVSKSIVNQSIKPIYKEHFWIDSRGHESFAEYEDKYGPFFNLIKIQIDSSGRVCCYFRLYNLIAYSFVLASSSNLDSSVVDLVSNPSNPKIFSLNNGDFSDSFYEWSVKPDNNKDKITKNITRLLVHFDKLRQPLTIDALISTALENIRARIEKEGSTMEEEIVREEIEKAFRPHLDDYFGRLDELKKEQILNRARELGA